MKLKTCLCAVLPAFVACAAPNSGGGNPACADTSCTTLADVRADQPVSLRGTGINHSYDASGSRTATSSVAFTTSWGRLDSAPAALSITVPMGDDPPSELVRDGVAVNGLVYAETAVTGIYDFVRAFTINEPEAMGGREIYAGVHGFVPTREALRMVNDTIITYRGEAFGEIAYTGVTSGAVRVSGGTALMMADFNARTASLTLTVPAGLITMPLEITYTGLALGYSGDVPTGDFSTGMATLKVQAGTDDVSNMFDAMSATADGSFYGWNLGRTAPAEVGGSARLVGTDAGNFVNLLFLGAAGPVDPVCTGAMACDNLAGLSVETRLAGTAVNPGDRSVYETVADWRPAGLGGPMAGVRSITGGSLFTNPTVDLPSHDPRAAMPNSYVLLTGDFDGDPMTDATAMTDGYDFVQAYTVSNPGQTELYRGVHGIPFGGALPTSGRASYRGRYLMDDGNPAGWFGGENIDNLFRLTFTTDGSIVQITIPANEIPEGRAGGFKSQGLSVGIFAASATISDSPFQLGGRSTNGYTFDLSAGFYGFDPDAGGQGIGGPDETAGVLIVTGTSGIVDGTNLTVLFVAD